MFYEGDMKHTIGNVTARSSGWVTEISDVVEFDFESRFSIDVTFNFHQETGKRYVGTGGWHRFFSLPFF